MEANPANELEFSWYLNNSDGRRTLLLAKQLNNPLNRKQDHDEQLDNQSAEANRRSRLSLKHKASSSGESASSQLTYSLDSQLDYGRLYCLARNSIGEQRLACVYEIQPPGKFLAEIVAVLLPFRTIISQ